MVSWLVYYLAKGPRPDFNKGPRITRIVAALLPPCVYSSQTRIMALFQSWSDGRYFCSVADLWSPGECNTGQGPQA